MNFNYSKDFKTAWINEKIDESGISYLSEFGKFLCDLNDRGFPSNNGVTTAQLRNIFSEVKRIDIKLEDENYDWKTDCLMLRPKIAYNTARTLVRTYNKSKMKELREILENALKVVSTKEDFHRFAKFFEGIIAYHKVFGGKE